MNRSSPVYLDPRRGDTVRRGGNTYRVVSRGVAGSVRFNRIKGKNSLLGQKSLPCWRRLIEDAELVTEAPR